MNRYLNSTAINDVSGKRRRETIIPPTPTYSTEDVYIQTTTVERLDLLAHKLYGDTSLWWAIAAANGLGKGSLYVPQNAKLRIPSISTIEQQIETLKLSR